MARQPAGDEGDGDERDRGREECQPIVDANADQEGLEEAARGGGHQRAEECTRRGQASPLPHDGGQDVPALRAEGQADSRGGRCEMVVAGQGADKERREGQRETREERDEDGAEAGAERPPPTASPDDRGNNPGSADPYGNASTNDTRGFAPVDGRSAGDANCSVPRPRAITDRSGTVPRQARPVRRPSRAPSYAKRSTVMSRVRVARPGARH